MYGQDIPTPANCLEVPKETLTERLEKERRNLQVRIEEIDAVLSALRKNPETQALLDLLQKMRCW